MDLGFMTLSFGKKHPPSVEVGEDTAFVKGFRAYYNPDDLVGLKGLETYDKMERHAQIQACLSIKKASVLARGWEVASDKRDGARGAEVADFCRWALEWMSGNLSEVLENVLDALGKGYSIQNFVWDTVLSGKYAGKWAPKFLKDKDPSEWDFKVDEFKNVVGLIHSPTQKEHPRSYFVLYTHRGKYGNPYGISDLRACYRNWWSGDFLERFWNLYLEKFGSPTAVGKYRRGVTTAVRDAFLSTIGSIQKQSAFVIPDDMTVELLETIRQGDVGYRIAVEYHNRMMAKAILNQTLITDESSSGVGSFAMAKIHLDVLRMCLKGLKMDLEESVVREQILRPMVTYNYGPEVPTPLFSLGPLEERDVEPLSRAAKNLVEAGVISPDDPWLKEFLGIQGSGPAPNRPDAAPAVSRARVDGDTNDGKVSVA